MSARSIRPRRSRISRRSPPPSIRCWPQMADAERHAGPADPLVHGALDWMFPVEMARQAQRALSRRARRHLSRDRRPQPHLPARNECRIADLDECDLVDPMRAAGGSGGEVKVQPPTHLRDQQCKLTAADTPAGQEYATVHVVFELSKAKWLVGVLLPGAAKESRYWIEGGDLAALSNLLARAHAKAAELGKPVRILSCYEAGFDGHWLHRWLSPERRDQLPSRRLEHRGQPPCAPRQDRQDRPCAADADLPELPARRPAGLQHGSPSDARGGGSQAAHARARAAGDGAHGSHQPDQGTAARSRHPRCDAVEAGLPGEVSTRFAPATDAFCPLI